MSARGSGDGDGGAGDTVLCNWCGEPVSRDDAEWFDVPEADVEVDESGNVESYEGTTGYVHRHAFCSEECETQYSRGIMQDGKAGVIDMEEAYSNEPTEVVPEEEVEA